MDNHTDTLHAIYPPCKLFHSRFLYGRKYPMAAEHKQKRKTWYLNWLFYKRWKMSTLHNMKSTLMTPEILQCISLWNIAKMETSNRTLKECVKVESKCTTIIYKFSSFSSDFTPHHILTLWLFLFVKVKDSRSGLYGNVLVSYSKPCIPATLKEQMADLYFTGT